MTWTVSCRGSLQAASHLSLVPVTAEMRSAFQISKDSFATCVGRGVPARWPEFPEAFAPLTTASSEPWTGYLFVTGDRLVGNGGFFGPPDQSKTVEIGFEIAPEFRNRGYATAGARRLIVLALENGASRVVAHTLAGRNASNTALRNAGMAFLRERPDQDLGRVWQFELNWPGLA